MVASPAVAFAVICVVGLASCVVLARIKGPRGRPPIETIVPPRDPALPRPAPAPFIPAGGPFRPSGDAARRLSFDRMILLTQDLDEAAVAMSIAARAGRSGFNGIEAALAVLIARDGGYPLCLDALSRSGDACFRYDIVGILAHLDRDTGVLAGFEPLCGVAPARDALHS
jgi:hypothetical protein